MINEVTSDNSDNPELTSNLPAALYTALNTAPNSRSDLVELYNKGDQAVDITGWKQADSEGREPSRQTSRAASSTSTATRSRASRRTGTASSSRRRGSAAAATP